MARALLNLALCFLLVVDASAGRASEAKNNPVTKVVTLLKDMTAQLEKEAKDDEEVYEAMGCWCETNEKGKTKAISDAKVRITQLVATSERSAALVSQTTTELESLEAELAENTQALDSATALRKKQLAEFSEEEADMVKSISSLGSAVSALSKHNSFLQISAQRTSLVTSLRSALKQRADMLEGIPLTMEQRRALTSFVQDGSSQQGGPNSGAIFGILETMKETFETNLKQSQAEETTNQQAYEDLKAAKTAEITAGQEQIAAKTQLSAEAAEKKAQSDQDNVETQANLEADTKFLADLKEKCKNVDAEFEERTKTRQLEIGAVGKALEVLSSDDAQDLVAGTLGLVQQPAFVQKMAVQDRQQLANKLEAASKTLHDPRLSMLATRVRNDAFAKVRQSLQDMVDKLIKEKEDEIKKKDFCVDEMQKNLVNIETQNRAKADAAAKVDDHAAAISTLTKDIGILKAEIDDQLKQIKKAGEEREKANKEYQETVADQRATQKLLASALKVLKGFYEKPALMQVWLGEEAPAGPPPPPSFKKYEKNAASGGVMGMIQGIIDDAKAMEAEAIKSEEDSMTSYEGFVADSNASIESKRKDVMTKTELKAKEEQDRVMEQGNVEAAEDSLEQLKAEELDLHADCDYLIKNFETRLTRRDEEVEALKEGLATFSGAVFSSFLQAW